MKNSGDRLPHFTGRISKPADKNDPVIERRIALWAGRDKNGNVYFSGKIDQLLLGTDALSQIDAMVDAPVYDITDVAQAGTTLSPLTVRPNEIVLFTNKFRDAANPDRPHFWGRANFGDGTEIVHVGTWARQDRYGRPLLTGATTYPLPGQDITDLTDVVDLSTGEVLTGQAAIDHLTATGAVSKGMPDHKGSEAPPADKDPREWEPALADADTKTR